MTDEEKKAIEWLYKKTFSDNSNGIAPSTADTILNLIEKQQKEIEEKNIAINKQSITISKQLQEIERFNNEMDLDYIDNNFVSKKKIQYKIDELNKQIEELKKNAFSKGLDEVGFDFWITELNKAIAKRNVLQELLESEE